MPTYLQSWRCQPKRVSTVSKVRLAGPGAPLVFDVHQLLTDKDVMTTKFVLYAAFVLATLFAAPCFARDGDSAIAITRGGSQPSVVAPPERVAGAHVVDPLFGPNKTASRSGSKVVFLPKSRTAWHSHPRGQSMIVVAGTGWIQQWGGEKLEVKAGDVVWFPPGVKHWHGATNITSMTSIEIQDVVDGRSSNWMEPVTDKQFLN
jgi:4-carboxymuconolactone decarboxylase